MKNSLKVLSIAITLVLIVQINAKPPNDRIIFRDQDEPEDVVGLADENQILPSEEGKLIADENEIVEQHLENGNFFQGDIVLVQDQKDYLLANDTGDGSLPTRTGWIDEFYRWPKDKHGNVILPYHVSSKSGYCKMLKRV